MRPIADEMSFVQSLIHGLLNSPQVKSFPLLTNRDSGTHPVSRGSYNAGMRRKAKVHGRRTFRTYGKIRRV